MHNHHTAEEGEREQPGRWSRMDRENSREQCADPPATGWRLQMAQRAPARPEREDDSAQDGFVEDEAARAEEEERAAESHAADQHQRRERRGDLWFARGVTSDAHRVS